MEKGIEKEEEKQKDVLGNRMTEESTPDFEQVLVEWQPFLEELTTDFEVNKDENLGAESKPQPLKTSPEGIRQKSETEYIQLEEVLPRFVDDRDFYFEMLSEFLESAQTRIDEMSDAIQQGDGKRLNFLAHRFKGMAANLGADEIAQIAQRLEDWGAQAHLKDCSLSLADLEMEIKRLTEWYHHESARMSNR